MIEEIKKNASHYFKMDFEFKGPENSSSYLSFEEEFINVHFKDSHLCIIYDSIEKIVRSTNSLNQYVQFLDKNNKEIFGFRLLLEKEEVDSIIDKYTSLTCGVFAIKDYRKLIFNRVIK
jgi:hypothetical protein